MKRKMMSLTHDQIVRTIPYALICETHDGSRWDTGKRFRLWMERFTDAERHAAGEIFRKAHRWCLCEGVPNHVVMSTETYRLWMKIGAFCAEL